MYVLCIIYLIVDIVQTTKIYFIYREKRYSADVCRRPRLVTWVVASYFLLYIIYKHSNSNNVQVQHRNNCLFIIKK